MSASSGRAPGQRQHRVRQAPIDSRHMLLAMSSAIIRALFLCGQAPHC